MVHLRLKERESNPNPNVNFITPLPDDNDDARQLLRALAAQVRPVMKAHGFVVNSLEEYEYNQVFAGRNWNNGETVELVLRRPGGSFYPASWLMSTLCHELAHIKHMNHGPAFQVLWKQLRIEVRQLQDRGYYGDGYWSAGTRLADSARISGQGIEAGDLPEYMCGGAQTRTRPTARRRRVTRGKRREVVPSNHTGRQTERKRKAGARVTSKYAFAGEGASLAGGSTDGIKKGKGKRAVSKRGREERALAAERRLGALMGEASPSQPVSGSESSDDEVEIVGETDKDRRDTLLAAKQVDDLEVLDSATLWKDFEGEFDFGVKPEGSKPTVLVDDVIDISSDEEGGRKPCDLPVASGSTYTSGGGKGLKKETTRARVLDTESSRAKATNLGPIGIGKIVQTEVDLRKKESLGLAPVKGAGRTLGGSGKSIPKDLSPTWSCHICMLENKPGHLACSACATPRGQQRL